MKGLIRENMLLEVFDQNKNTFYKSIVQEVNEEDFAIGVPMKKNEQVALHEGESLVLKFVLEDALYYFQSKVAGVKISGQVLLYLIPWPEKVQRLQRREFFRFPCVIDLFYWLLPESGDLSNGPPLEKKAGKENAGNAIKGQHSVDRDEQEFLLRRAESLGESQKAEAVDISGGGLLMVTDRKLLPGDRLLLCLLFGSNREGRGLMVKGEILRDNIFTFGKLERYRYGVKFLNINEKVRDEIIGFIFAKSRERIRWGG
jgi:c-di-GMP-binding flagellar brake protein YcgR